MEITNFIKENKINDFLNLKAILESQQFGLKIKEDNELPNLFLIHTQDTSNFSLKFINECNGIIMDKNTFQIVCYTFDKCADKLLTSDLFDYDNLYYENAFEGTLIRLYYYNNKWNVSTKKCLNASKSKWISNKNFAELFNECIEQYNITNKLNTSYCYSFIITHPENKIVVPYTEPNLYHISTRDMTTLQEIEINIDVPKSERFILPKDNLNSLIDNINNSKLLLYEGCILIDTKYNRIQVKGDYFRMVRSLWGNTNNRFYRYIELRKNINILQEYLTFFENDKLEFIKFEEQICLLAKEILKVYADKHITKTNVKIPFYFAKIIYKLHGDFYKDKIKTNFDKVMMTLLELDPKQVCFMYNNSLKEKEKENVLMDI